MKTVNFKPLRRIKKTGKICVASYTGWRKVMTADYSKFNLIVDNEYKKFPKDEYVYNHKGDLLYFFIYNPADITVFDANTERILNEDWLEKLHESKKPYGIRWNALPDADGFPNHVMYRMNGADCSGVPTFSHWDEERITQEDTWNYYGHEQFEPLTVGIVAKWYGWFLWQLQNSNLSTK